MNTLRRFLPDMLAVMAFVIIAFVYFFEPVRDGKVLTGVDNSAAIGSGIEMKDYMDRHNGERTRWTNSLFSGMPTYQMAPSYNSTNVLSKVEDVYNSEIIYDINLEYLKEELYNKNKWLIATYFYYLILPVS